MSANAGSAVPITWEALASHQAQATTYLKGVSYNPAKTVESMSATRQPKVRPAWSDSRAAEAPKADSISVLSIAKAVNQNDDLLPEPISAALNIVRTGLQIAMQVANLYAQASGFDTLRERKNASHGTFPDEAEWAAKQTTQAAITAFVLAYYVSWRFESQDEKKYSAEVDFAGLPEPIAVGNQPRAIQCVIYHWGSHLKTAQTGAQLHKLTQLYFAAVQKEMQARSDGFKHVEPFTGTTYQLESSNFVIRGFQGATQGGSVVEFKRTEAQQIVGNHEMKRKLKQIAQMLIAYDVTAKRNPLVDFDALTWLGVIQGWPGTGKSMGLSYLQTLVSDYCKALGLPFRLIPILRAMVSSLQGESARIYENWYLGTMDPAYINLAPVDDCEAIFLDRRSQSSSEGSKLIVQTHLGMTEGSTAVYVGNSLHVHATNNADIMDPAVFSRYQFRIKVPGAESRHDFCDQMRLMGDELNAKAKKPIIDLSFPKDYQYLSDQGFIPKEEREERLEAFVGFKDTQLEQLWEEVGCNKLDRTSYDLYGTFFEALHRRFEQFTSRDSRNVFMNAKARLFGFDFPQEWLENRDAFVEYDFDKKKDMILDAALQHQQGLTVDQVLFDEMVHYVETTIEMLDSGRQYRIRQMADEVLEREEAIAMAHKMREERGLLVA